MGCESQDLRPFLFSHRISEISWIEAATETNQLLQWKSSSKYTEVKLCAEHNKKPLLFAEGGERKKAGV